jgi:hypothetical protein
MQNNKAHIDSVLAQSAHVLRRVAVIRDHGFVFDADTSILVDQTIKMLDELFTEEPGENNSHDRYDTGPHCDGMKIRKNR